MTTAAMITTTANVIMPRQADSDDQLIELWLHGRPVTTSTAYRADVNRFLGIVAKSLQDVTLGDLQAHADLLEMHELQPSTRHRKLAAIKSLFAFGHKIGYLQFDVARPLRLPTIRDSLSERILTEAEVHRLILSERHPRNHAMLYLLYASGVRVSELCQLSWRDCQDRANGCGQICILGKGGKTNVILIPASVWTLLTSLRCGAGDDQPVFRSRKDGHLHQSQVRRVVTVAARKAGIQKAISPHWMRHAHASHALDRGAPIHVVQQTLNHSNIAVTSRYLHARPNESSASYLPL
jgi:integrase/recombinase XerD